LAQRYNLDQQTIDSITHLAEGNLRFAFDLAEASGKELPESDPEKDHFTLLRDWMRKIYVYGVNLNDYGKLLETISNLIGDGSREKQKDFLSYCLKILRLCLHCHIGNTQLVKYSGEEQDFIAKFSAFIHPRNIGMMEQEFNKAIMHIERNANASLVFTDLSLILSRLIKIPSSAHLKKM
jgi:DNA polymerase-3 subunit delta'